MATSKTEIISTTVDLADESSTATVVSESARPGKLSAESYALSKKISADITLVDGKLVIDPDSYVKHLPHDLLKEDVRKVHAYNSMFYPAVTLAVGDAGIAAMKADKKINEIAVEVPLIENDIFNVHLQRESVRNVPESDKTVTKYAEVKVGIDTRATRSKHSGDMMEVYTHLAAQALAALGK